VIIGIAVTLSKSFAAKHCLPAIQLSSGFLANYRQLHILLGVDIPADH